MTPIDEPNANQPGEISQFKCDFCAAIFETEEELRKHEEICTGDKFERGL
jgi:hypothetical protein